MRADRTGPLRSIPARGLMMPLYLTLKSLPELRRRMWRERRQACWQMGMKPLGHVSVWVAMAITCLVLLWAVDTIAGTMVFYGDTLTSGGFDKLVLGAGAAALAALLLYRHAYLFAMRQYVGYTTFDRTANPLVAWLKSLLISVVSIVFIVCGVLALDWVINSFDSEPDPVVATLKKWPDPIPSEGNGYIAAVGLMASPKESPFKAGADWLDAANEATVKHTGQYPKPLDGLKYVRYEDVHGKQPGRAADAWLFCRFGADDCMARLQKERKDVEAWMAANDELLARYLTLKKYPQWQETRLPGEVDAPIASMGWMMRGQNLMQVSALLDMDKKQTYRALLLIGDDINFLRIVLAGKNTLLTQMIASTMLARDYALLAELIGERPDAIKPFWRNLEKMLTPLTASELSMQSAFRFEEKWAVGVFESQSMRELVAGADIKALDTAWAAHHLKRYDTLNLVLKVRGRQFSRYKVGDPANLPPFKAVEEREPRLFSRTTGFMHNQTGKAVALLYLPDYSVYANRQVDLNALNRLVRLRLALAEKKVAPEDVPAFLADDAHAEFRNPETGKPFEWDADTRVVYFVPATAVYRRNFNFGDHVSGRVGLTLAGAEGKPARKARHKG